MGGQMVMGRHLAQINQALIDIACGRLKRLIVSLPPRHTKTLLCARAFILWYLGSFPDNRVIYATYNDSLAAELGWNVRRDFDAWGNRLFGLTLSKEAAAKKWWHIEGHGEAGFQAGGWASLGGGLGADLLILDDLIKGSRETDSQQYRDSVWNWYQSFTLARLQPNAAVVVIGTRWSSDDVTGRILERPHNEWRELKYPAKAEDNDPLDREAGDWLFPEFKPIHEYEEAERDIAPFYWAAQWQQRPGLNVAAEFPDEYFSRPDFWFHDWPADISPRVVFLDPSKGRTDKSDYSAFVRLGTNYTGELWVQGYLGRKPTPVLVDEALWHMRDFEPTAIAVEEAAWQELIATILEDRMRQGGVPSPDRFGSLSHQNINKQTRIRRLAPWLANGLIHFHDDPQTRLLVQQLREFPQGTHDDGPDALEGAIRLLAEVGDGFEDNYKAPRVPVEYR